MWSPLSPPPFFYHMVTVFYNNIHCEFSILMGKDYFVVVIATILFSSQLLATQTKTIISDPQQKCMYLFSFAHSYFL